MPFFHLVKKKHDSQVSLNDYLLRAINLYNRDASLQQRFSSPYDPEFLRYIDTEAILYIREIQEVGIPFPPWQEMVTVGGETDLRTFLTIGYSCYESVRRFIPNGMRLPIRILDFGVGCGRTIRFFFRDYEKFECYGCDVDRRAIDYLKRCVPFIHARVNDNLPPLPYRDSFFDVIYSISVFTHLDLKAFVSWMRELYRILRNTGILEVSLHGRKAFDTVTHDTQWRHLIGITDDEFTAKKPSFETSGFVWMKQPVGSTDIDTSQFGISFITRDYFERLISPYFILIDYVEGEIGNWQDMAILKKVSLQ